MGKPKKQSKRMPARKKYKIQKKVREHNRKIRKEAKAKANSKKLKKDPGIPNLFPFKEQLLQQYQARKERAEGEKERQRLLRQQEHARRRRSLQGLKNDALKRTKEFEKKGELASDMKSAAERCGLQADQSLRAYYKEFRKVVEMSDVVLEVLDARDPLGCRCLQVEQAILTSPGAHKKLILVLNKIDLVPREVVEKWLKYLRREFPTIAFKASTQTQKHNLAQKKFALGTGPTSLMGSSACLGADVLLKLLGNYCRNADIRTSITVGVVGLPNVGKSSLINSLKRSRACNVGAVPGLTKSIQEIHLDKHVKLLDSPGVVMATDSGDTASMILRNCVKLESLTDPISPVQSILRRCNKFQVLRHYCIPEFKGVQEFLSHLAHKTGKLKKGGVPDVDAAARSVLRDWNTGKITFYTHPPEEDTLTGVISTEIVQQWGKAFDIDALIEEEKKELAGLAGVKGEMMELEPSEPLLEAFPEEGKEEVEDNTIEEDMESEVSEGEESDEEMSHDEDDDAKGGEMTVLMEERPAKKTAPSLTKKEAKELRQLNPQPAKEKRKEMKRKEKLIRQIESRSRTDQDGDVILDEDDAYDFAEHF